MGQTEEEGNYAISIFFFVTADFNNFIICGDIGHIQKKIATSEISFSVLRSFINRSNRSFNRVLLNTFHDHSSILMGY